jgi:hypothetical protein
MEWAVILAAVALAGVGITLTLIARRRNKRAKQTPGELRSIPAPRWVGEAAMALGKGNFLDVVTARTVAELGRNQGRFLPRREFKPANDEGIVAIPTDAYLNDMPNDVFVHRDRWGNYHLFTLGHIASDHVPQPGTTCVEATLSVTPWNHTP